MARSKIPKGSEPAVDGSFDLNKELAFIMWLARDVLGYGKLTALHADWFREILTSTKTLFLAPRSHFKTTCLSVIYIIYRIVRNTSVRILLVNEILANAQSFLTEIKQHMENNDAFRSHFGELNMSARKWTESQIALDCVRLSKDPTVSVAGTLGAINSKHVDMLMIDDPISDRNSMTILQRNKIKRWLYQTVIPILEPDGQIVITGTRWHGGDVYGDILTEKRFAAWKKIVLKAEWDDEDGKHHILFPERFSQAKLDELKLEMGTAFYNAQYLNDPTQLEGQQFQFDWLKFFVTEPKTLNIIQGVDLAISKAAHAAKFALVTIGIPPEGDIYILDVVAERLDFPQQCKLIKAQAAKWNPSMIVIESNAYQSALPQWMMADPDAKRLPIRDVKAVMDKITHLATLASLFEAGVIKVREQQHNFIDEYLAFPRGSTFDILDALLIAIEGSRNRILEPMITEVEL